MSLSDVITTERLMIRPSEASDREDLHALEQDPIVMRFLNGGKPTSINVVGSNSPFLMPRGDDTGVWSVYDRSTEVFAGWVSLRNRGSLAWLGFRLHQAGWGKGLATEASCAAIEHGFDKLKLDTIAATTMAVNLASRRVLEKIGMRFVRSFREVYPEEIPGSEQGEVEYRLQRHEWRSARS